MNKLENIHPGEVLLEEFIKPLNLDLSSLSKEIKIRQNVLEDLINEKNGISIPIAIRLAKYFNTSYKFWIGLQNDYDLEVEEKFLESHPDFVIQ